MQGGIRLRQIAAGGAHSCGVDFGGQAYCWGDNQDGELGDGTTAPHFTPVQVVYGPFLGVSPGDGLTCGVLLDHRALCWSFAGSAMEVTDGITGPLKVESLNAGSGHTCAVGQDRRGYCWGFGAQGQLGNGTTNSSTNAVQIAAVP